MTSAIVTCSKCQRVIGSWNDYLEKVSPGATIVWNIQAGAPTQDADNYAGQTRTDRSDQKPSTLG